MIPVPVGQEECVDGGEVDIEAASVVDPDVPVRSGIEECGMRLSATATDQEH